MGWKIFAIVVVILLVVLGVLYWWGRKLQKQQVQAEAQMEAMKQVTSMLIIDKKLLRPKESGLPEMVISQIPWYARRSKLPIVKVKVGPKMTVMMADRNVWDILPIKKECKVTISGMYITELKSVRGMSGLPEAPKKVPFFKRIFKKNA